MSEQTQTAMTRLVVEREKRRMSQSDTTAQRYLIRYAWMECHYDEGGYVQSIIRVKRPALKGRMGLLMVDSEWTAEEQRKEAESYRKTTGHAVSLVKLIPVTLDTLR